MAEKKHFKDSYDVVVIGGALAGLASDLTLAKMGKNEEVALSVLTKICEKYDCTYGDLISFEKNSTEGEEQ